MVSMRWFLVAFLCLSARAEYDAALLTTVVETSSTVLAISLMPLFEIQAYFGSGMVYHNGSNATDMSDNDHATDALLRGIMFGIIANGDKKMTYMVRPAMSVVNNSCLTHVHPGFRRWYLPWFLREQHLLR